MRPSGIVTHPHAPPRRITCKNIGQISDEEFIKLHSEINHIGKLAAVLQVPHITVWRRAKLLNLIFDRSSNFKNRVDLQEILEGKHPFFQTFKLKNRLLKEGIFENRCAICGIDEWNGKALNMQLDHINGNSSDHRLENLRMICPNCHSQTETYCGKNK